MYYDLFVPFPTPQLASDSIGGSKKSKNKGKAKTYDLVSAASPLPASDLASSVASSSKDCWAGLNAGEKKDVASRVALQGHLGYDVLGLTVIVKEPTVQVTPCPFGFGEGSTSVPYPELDPRFSTHLGSSSPSASTTTATLAGRAHTGTGRNQAVAPKLVQVSRYHYRLDDSKTHPFTASNANALRAYDLLSVSVSSERSLQIASSDLAMPGPNQVSIITLPLHERAFHFRLNRKQIKQAIRNGVVFEILYGAGLFPSSSVPPDVARKYRQNFLSNAREVVRITGGRGIIFSSGPGGSLESSRGPQDVVNLGTILGLPANLAKDAVSLTPKAVILRAQSRRTYKAILSAPRMVSSDADKAAAAVTVDAVEAEGKKRANGDDKDALAKGNKKVRT